MKAAIYARYSAGPRQTDQSIEGQLRVCRTYCEQKGLLVVGEYCDRHISGRTDDRPEFQRLIADAKRRLFDAVVVYKTDRFARNKYDSAVYKRELKKNGVQIFYAAESIPDGPEGIILESLMEGLAEYYSAELAQKIKRGMHENALKGKSTGSGIPLGYTVDPDTKLFQLDPDGAQAIHKIFDMYIAGEPNAAICDFLNSLGMRTARKRPFNKNSVNRIVTNRKYLGEYSYNGVVIPNGMPRIISDEIFAQAQAEFEKRKARRTAPAPRGEYLLAGKLFCGHCGAGMVGVSGTAKSGQKYYYYYCPNNRGKKKDCDKKQVARDDLEARVADLVIDYVLRRDVLENVSRSIWELQNENDASREELRLYEKKLQDNKNAIENVLQAIESGVGTKSLPARLRKLEDEQTVLQGEIARLKIARPNLSEEQILFALLRFMDRQEGGTDRDFRRRLIKCFVSEVYLWDDRILLFFNISGPDGKLRSVDLAGFDESSNCSTSIETGRTQIRPLAYGFVLDQQNDM